MFKTAIKQCSILFCGVLIFFFFAIIQSATVHAATQQIQTGQADTPSVTLSQTGQADPAHAIGHPGTLVTVSIKGFAVANTASTVNLYTTTDPAQCIANGNGLQPFTGYTPITTDTMGNKDLTNIPWPANANQATSNYYVCAISTTPAPAGLQAVSTQSFTVAQAVTVTPASATIQPGNPITITGANWLPAQQVTVAVGSNRASGQNVTLVQGMTNSDNDGNFTINLTIPANATPGSYAIRAAATNEPLLTFQQDSLLTVSAPAPTPTVAPTPTPTVVPSPTPTPTVTAAPTTPGSNNSGGGGGLTTVLIFTLGGLGILLIVVGVIMFAASSPTAPAAR